jgi:hypothetical protein
MTQWKITLYGYTKPNDPYFSSTFKRKYEASTLECAMKQAKSDLEMAEKLFVKLLWNVQGIEEVEAATK